MKADGGDMKDVAVPANRDEDSARQSERTDEIGCDSDRMEAPLVDN